ncbi:MAG: hypothetical protein WA840_01030 [Caulobacteraceae bacterium]
MTELERRALGASRRLAFQNIANGVPLARVMTDMRMSELEVDRAVRFVGRKITEHLVLRRQPPIPCADLRAVRWNRRNLLAVLARIGDLDLSTDLILGKITVQSLDHPEMVQGVKRRMTEAYR